MFMVLEYPWGRMKRGGGGAGPEAGVAQAGGEEATGYTGEEQWKVRTFVFSCSSGLRAHGAAHKHSVAPIEGLIYQGHS